MQLTEGQRVDTTGTIRNRKVFRRDNGQTSVRATLVMDDDNSPLPVVWWDAGSAPPAGARVWIMGRIGKYRKKPELRAYETRVDRVDGGEFGKLSSIAAYYRACVETEAAMSLRFRLDDSGHLMLDDTASPVHESLCFSLASPHYAWFQDNEKMIGKGLLTGWPLVIGNEPMTARRNLVVSPLLIAEVKPEQSDGTWTLRIRGPGANLNPYALDLLGLDEDERNGLMAKVEASVEVEESETPVRRSHAILRMLEDKGIDGLKDLDPTALSPVHMGDGIHNTGVVMTASAGTRIVHGLVADLQEIINNPEMLASGPAAVLLGHAPAADAPLPEPQPTITPSLLYQDKTVHSSMVNNFTVVTGPPGTGKSQVLVNVVAAAVARGDTVLFASKNHRAVDVVVQRLRNTSPGSIVVRAGTANDRNKMAESIVTSLSADPRDVDPVDARDAWKTIERSLLPLYRSLRERHALETEFDDCQSELKAILDRFPPGTRSDVDLPQLDAALADACRALDAFGHRLWWFGRWRRHHRRLMHARQTLRRVSDILGTRRADIESCLSAVAERPMRTLAPRHAFRSVEQVARDLLESVDHRRRIDDIRTRLSVLPPKHELDDRLHELREARLKAGLQLLDARWKEVRRDTPEAFKEALRLAKGVERIYAKEKGARNEAFQALPKALPALPVWAVTNLSAHTNLPLKPGLFDLVVIDEASQCDIASAVPLLVRGKRALIIGDQQQLIHIASLSQGRERIIARRSGLTDAQAREFSYIDMSCFALAALRVSPGPVFLDLHFRSHPAIISFSNKRFYGGRLELCSKATAPKGKRAVEWVPVIGESKRGPDGKSRMNEVEAQGVVQVIVDDLATYKNDCSVGIVTPYVAQMRRINELLEENLSSDERAELMTATAHRFQGDERDVMYFSPVIDRRLSESEVRFASNSNLVNVAITRARQRLVIVGDPDACRAHDNTLCALADYVLHLQESGFQSPLELDLSDALRKAGIAARSDVRVREHRLALAVEHDGIRLDIESDGEAFPVGEDGPVLRDEDVEAAGWSVMRFSARDLRPDNFDTCVKAILGRIAAR